MPQNSQFSSLGLMSNRLELRGGFPQSERMIRDKRWTLDRAVKYSYQAAKIHKTDSEDMGQAPALINPDKLKQDYDDKVLSVGFEYDFHPGDVFDWMNTGSKWIIYLQDLDELAYFRGNIRRCRYWANFKDETTGEVHKQWLAVRGPVETKINFIQKKGVSVDEPNHSINFLMTKTPWALRYFRRYAKLYLGGIDEDDQNVCYRVEAVDSISMPGIIEINAVEYFANETEDITVPNESMVKGKLEEPVDPNGPKELNEIKGETFIRPKVTYKYFYRGDEKAKWELADTKGAKITLDQQGKTATVKWELGYSGQFVLKYGSTEKTIVVESLF